MANLLQTGGGSVDLSTCEKIANKDAANGYAGLTAGSLLKTAEFPAPTSTLFGGVKALAAVAKKYLTSIGTDGIPVAAQPQLSDLSDTPTQNLVVASPNGSTGAVTARALVAADLPAPTAVVGNDGFFAPLDVMVIPSPASDSATGNQFTANNVVWVRQFTLSRAHVVGNLVVTVTAAVAASTFDVGIFDVSKNKLLSLGSTAGTATGNKTATFAQITLPAGTYHLAWTATATTGVATLSLREVLMNSDLQTGTTTLMINVNGARFGTAANAGVSGVLPASLGVITKSNSTAAYAPIMFCEP